MENTCSLQAHLRRMVSSLLSRMSVTVLAEICQYEHRRCTKCAPGDSACGWTASFVVLLMSLDHYVPLIMSDRPST